MLLIKFASLAVCNTLGKFSDSIDHEIFRGGSIRMVVLSEFVTTAVCKWLLKLATNFQRECGEKSARYRNFFFEHSDIEQTKVKLDLGGGWGIVSKRPKTFVSELQLIGKRRRRDWCWFGWKTCTEEGEKTNRRWWWTEKLMTGNFSRWGVNLCSDRLSEAS